jgi:MarR family
MPRVEVLTEVSGRDPEATLTDHTPSEMLAGEDDADQLVERVGWGVVDAERRVKESHAGDGGSAAGAPARSVRRATARRASNRRATARSRQGDTEASIIEFLARHPGSTAGDLAKGLNLNPGSVSSRLTQLAKAGEIKRASHGYSTKQALRPRGHARPPGRSH